MGFKDSIASFFGAGKKVSAVQESREVTRLKRALIAERATHYNAAYTNRIRDDWSTTSSIPYTDIKTSLANLIARSRREIDNNGIASGIRRTIINNVWGEGPVVQAQVKYANGNVQERVNDQLEAEWVKHVEEMDASGHSFFNAFGRMALETIITSGTVIINRVPPPKDNRLGLAYQMLEPDVLDDGMDNQRITKEMNERAKQILHGVSVDENYRPVEYFIKGVRKPISANYMRHFYIRNRPNQIIGVPWLHASLPDLFDYRQLKEDTLIKSRILADIALWTSTSDPLFGDAIKNSDDEVQWEPGQIIRTQVEPKVIQPDGDLNTALKPLLNRVLLDACSGTGTSYMAVSRDMEGVNFAASRTNLNEDRAGYKTIRDWLVSSICQYFWNNFVYQCVLTDKIDIELDVFLRDAYRYTRVSFQFPAWDWVDPRADADAIVSMHDAKLMTLKEVFGKRGLDWRDSIEQYAEEIKYIRELAKSKDIPLDILMKMIESGGNINAKKERVTEE